MISVLHRYPVRSLGFLLVSGVMLISVHFYRLSMQVEQATAQQYAYAYVRSLDEVRRFYSKHVVDRLRPDGVEFRPDYAHVPGAVPNPATFSIDLSERLTERNMEIQARLYSDYPFPNRTGGGLHEDFERRALAALRADPSKPFMRIEDSPDGGRVLRHALAIQMEESCVSCHNSHPQSPRKDWKVGDVRGVQEVRLPVNYAVQTYRQSMLFAFSAAALLTVVGLLLLAIVLGKLRQSLDQLQVANRALEELNAASTRFVPQEFLGLLGSEDVRSVSLGDNVELEMTVLFSDIRSFTTLSEQMTPAESFRFINDYLSSIGPVIREHHGHIDKYIGDAIMALFERPEHAVDAAVAMQASLDRFNADRPEQPPIQVGIGLNTGRVMLGTIGESDRMDGTVIGDVVNVASRLEGLTKELREVILISDAVHQSLPEDTQLVLRACGAHRLSGKSLSTDVYAVGRKQQ